MRFTGLQSLRPGPVPSSWPAWGCGPLSRLLVWGGLLLSSALIAAGLTLLLSPPPTPSSVGPGQGGAPPVAYADPAMALEGSVPATAVRSLLGAEPGPARFAPSPAFTPPPCVPPADWGIHVVQPGNTLYSIGRRYGTDVDTLRGVNCLTTDTIFVNQQLYVPGMLIEMPASATPGALAAGPAAPGADRGPDPTSPPPESAPIPPPVLEVQLPQNVLNIVLLGSDRRPEAGAWRTDSMIIVSVEPQAGKVRMISIPRDLWVYIPSHGYDRINTADVFGALEKYPGGGPALVKATIYHNLGIPIHYYVRVDFEGFVQIVDAVGGIEVDVDCPLGDIGLSAGVQHLDGEQALLYARSRLTTNDLDRGRRQRKVLRALWAQALRFDIIPRLPKLWVALSGAFETDLNLAQILDLAYVGVGLKPDQILSTAIGPDQVQGWVTPGGAQVLLPRNDRIVALLNEIFAPPLPTAASAESARVEILNGSPRQEAGELAAAQMEWQGFQVSSTSPAERQDIAQTSILVYRGDAALGELLARVLRVPLERVQLQPDPSAAIDVRVILGRDYDACEP